MKTLIVAFVLVATSLVSAQIIVCPIDAPANVKLAGKEIRRYVYLRTGTLLPIAEDGAGIKLQVDPKLGREQYCLLGDGKQLTISGGSDVAVLYGAYAYAENLGVRFYLHGDVIPDEKIAFAIPTIDETHKPLFETRGIQPFHDFDEGPDWWNQDDYLAYVSQLAKMRMNFIGLHCYPEGGVGPEPGVWIGESKDVKSDGTVQFSYPTMWGNTARDRMWGYSAMKTGDFAGGAALLFPEDIFGPAVMKGLMPKPKDNQESNELFNRVGAMYRVAFGHAKKMGVKTCVGTETPLTIPAAVQARLKTEGKNPNDLAVVREIYEGMFRRIAADHPVDYYWLWTPEGWTWSGNKPEQFVATIRDIQAALDALKNLNNPFMLATCGWVLGPAHDRAALDAFLPKTSPMSCINRQVGHAGVEPAFANITGRAKWAIPWMENDPMMTQPQPWVARMRYDAVDAKRFGCTGLLGIHWRVKAMAMNVAALADAAWDQSWVPAGFDTKLVKPSQGSEGAIGGQAVRFTAPVADAGKTPQAVYQTVRYDLAGYNLNNPDGVYTVTLQFNEPHYTMAGKRVFGAKIQGKQVIEHLDIFARVGQNKALDLNLPNITVNDGTLKIEFTRKTEFPCIAGIIIEGKTKATNQLPSEAFVRRINCGGAAVDGYEADRVSGGMGTSSPHNRAMPIEDFYVDFARANFGDSVAKSAGKIFAKIDGVNLPKITDWKSGPGTVVANGAPWNDVKKRFTFVEELAALRPQVKGAGNLERFDYWLCTYQAMAAMAQAGCLRGQIDKAMAGKHYQQALATRVELAKVWTRLLTLQTAIVSTPGEMGTIANLEQHTRRHAQFIEGHDAALAKALGRPLPPEVQPGKDYSGPAKLIVPTVRTTVAKGEILNVKIIALDKQPVKSVAIHMRPLGRGDWQKIPAAHIGRAVYQASIVNTGEDFEYYITAEQNNGGNIVWPPAAPAINQTVVVE